MSTAPSSEAAIEVMRVYALLGEKTIELAEWVRSLGYNATAHHPYGDEEMPGNLLSIPIAYRCKCQGLFLLVR